MRVDREGVTELGPLDGSHPSVHRRVGRFWGHWVSKPTPPPAHPHPLMTPHVPKKAVMRSHWVGWEATGGRRWMRMDGARLPSVQSVCGTHPPGAGRNSLRFRVWDGSSSYWALGAICLSSCGDEGAADPERFSGPKVGEDDGGISGFLSGPHFQPNVPNFPATRLEEMATADSLHHLGGLRPTLGSALPHFGGPESHFPGARAVSLGRAVQT